MEPTLVPPPENESVVQEEIVLPDDDGRPLSEAERAALLSQGELDRGLSSEDMRDVVLHFKSLVHGRGRFTVERNVERCRPYLSYIRQVLREESLPEELAWLAFVESGYNPRARSRTGALGMWQFISSTGKAYGMDQNWWLDERRDPYQATRAAASYLSRLYELFNDWHLAVTAYNAGEGKISRALEATETTNFFDLRRRNEIIAEARSRLNQENSQYLPRFLAVCKIMRNLESLGFSPLKESENRVVRLKAAPQTDLLALSRASGLTWTAFSEYNPAYHHYINHPSRVTAVYVPGHAAADARAFLQNPARNSEGWRTYKAVRGDTYATVARKTGVPVSELRRLNTGRIRAGRELRVPRSTNLSLQASRSDTTARSGKKKAAARNGSKKASRGRVLYYEVQAGDSLWAIARKFNISPTDLLHFNKMDRNAKLRPGDTIRVAVK